MFIGGKFIIVSRMLLAENSEKQAQKYGISWVHVSSIMFYYMAVHSENTPIQIYWIFHHHKTEKFQIKSLNIFHISALNIDYGHSLEPPRRGGSNEYPQSVFLSRNKKNSVYPCKPQFY